MWASSRLGELRALVVEAETGQRGYLLTGRDTYLAPYERALRQLTALESELRSYYAERSDQASLDRFAAVVAEIGSRLKEMDFTIRLARDGREQQSLDLLRTDIGLIRMNQIKDGVEELQARERDRTTILVDEWRRSLAFSRFGVAALTALNIVLLVVILRWLKQHWRRGEERALELDKLVRSRTEQLARLSAYLQEVRDNEKTLLGRELHDELGAILTATRMDLLWVRGHLAPEQEQVLDKLRRAMTNLDQGIAIKRRIIEDLRPSILSNFGLMTATRVVAEQAAERSGWALELDLPPIDPDLDDDIEIAMFRILEEALANAAKYARAARVKIGLQCVAAESCQLEVEDNGVGFDSRYVGAECHGLAGMRQRLESRGGRLVVRSEPGKGTLVQATLPLRGRDTASG
jgi:signal transduction histidine kinase